MLPGWRSDRRDYHFIRGLEAARAFVLAHRKLPQADELWNGFAVGEWVKRRLNEYANGRLPADRAAALESIPGWTWLQPRPDPIAVVNELIADLGTSRIPRRLVARNGLRVGAWINLVRVRHRQGTLDPKTRSLLDAIPGWDWNSDRDDRIRTAESAIANIDKKNGSRLLPVLLSAEPWFRLGLAELFEYVAEHGTSNVPFTYRSPSGYELGYWCQNRRKARRQDRLSVSHERILAELPGWRWEKLSIGDGEMHNQSATIDQPQPAA
jgi:hypothetical protein